MMSKPIFTFRALLSLATLSACVLIAAPAAHAGLLGGGATGGLGGTLSPRTLDLNGQVGANVARDGDARLPHGEKLREAAGGAAAQAQGTLGAARGAAADKAQQTQGMLSGTVNGGANAMGAVAAQKPGNASASGSADVKPESRSVNASASGTASVGR